MNLKGLKVSAQDVQILQPGAYLCSLNRIQELTDRHSNFGGAIKTDNLPPWDDPTDQVALTYVCAGKGIITRRYPLAGYIGFDELSEAQKASGKFISANSGKGHEQYACVEGKDGKLYRVPSEPKTAAAIRILSDVARGFGAATDDDLYEALTKAIAEKRIAEVTVFERSFDGEAGSGSIMDVKSVRAPKVAVA